MIRQEIDICRQQHTRVLLIFIPRGNQVIDNQEKPTPRTINCSTFQEIYAFADPLRQKTTPLKIHAQITVILIEQ